MKKTPKKEPAKKSAPKSASKAKKTPVKKTAAKAKEKTCKCHGNKASHSCECDNGKCQCTPAPDSSCNCMEKLMNEIFADFDAVELVKDYFYTQLINRGFTEDAASKMTDMLDVNIDVEGEISIRQ